MDLLNTCRVCMQAIGLDYINLESQMNDMTYFECFNYCTKLEASFCDNLPHSLCGSCAKLLDMAYGFIAASKEADRLLRGLVDQMNECDNIKLPNIDDKQIELNESVSKETMLLPSCSDSVAIDIKPLKNLNTVFNNQLYTLQYDINSSNIATIEEQNLEFHMHVEKEEVELQEQNVELYMQSEKEEAELEVDVELENDIGQEDKTQKNDKELKDAPSDTVIEPADTNTGSALPDFEFQDVSDDKLIEDETIKTNQASCSDIVLKCQHKANHDDKMYKCNDSDNDELFYTETKLKAHNVVHHKRFKDSWNCMMCGEAFESKAKLENHSHSDHRCKIPRLCLTCGQSFSDENALQLHVRKEHISRKTPVKCPYCSRKFQLKTLPMHVRYTHPDIVSALANKEFTCKYCFHDCENVSQLEKHLKTHTGKHYYTCPWCEVEFKGKAVFDEHKSTVHGLTKESGKCSHCDFTTDDESILKKHKMKHRNKMNNSKLYPKYLCAYCPRRFAHPKPLAEHEDFQHGEKKNAYQCDLCDKKFQKNRLLRQHKTSTHGNERAFECKQCPKAFKLKNQLRTHEKIHNNKTIDCPHCDKKFQNQCYLKVHLRTHTGELPYECHLCEEKFPVKVRLTYHIARHKGVKRKCKYCPLTFDTVSKLRVHTFEHIGYPLVCDNCQQGFHKKDTLCRHMRREHNIQLTEEEINENHLRNVEKIYRSKQNKS